MSLDAMAASGDPARRIGDASASDSGVPLIECELNAAAPAPRPAQRGLVGAVFETASASVVFFAVTFVAGIVIARLLGPEGRGHYGALQFYAQLASYLFAFSLFEAAVVYIRRAGLAPFCAVPEVATVATLGGLLLTVVSMVLVGYEVITIEGVEPMLILNFVIVGSVFILVNRSFVALESAGLNFKLVNVDRIVTPSIFLFSLIGLAIGQSVTLEAVLVFFILSQLPMLAFWTWRYSRHVQFGIDRARLRSIGALAVRLHSSSVPLALALHIDRFVPIMLWSATELGYFFVAYAAVGAGLSFALQAIRLVIFPSLAGVEPKVRRLRIEQMVRQLLWISTSLAFAILLTAPLLVPFAFGEEFVPAVSYLQGLSFAMILMPVRVIKEVATRAGGRSLPGLEMAAVMLTVFAGGYVATGYDRPYELFAAIFIADLAAVSVAYRHLKADCDVSIVAMIPRLGDIRFLIKTFASQFGRGL